MAPRVAQALLVALARREARGRRVLVVEIPARQVRLDRPVLPVRLVQQVRLARLVRTQRLLGLPDQLVPQAQLA